MTRVLVTFGSSPANAAREAVVAMKIRYYVAKLKKHGMEPVFIWPNMEINLDALYQWCSCILLTGGGDFNAVKYGRENHTKNDLCHPGRDEMELSLLHRAFRDNVPVLGICRGAQAIAIARGGSLMQHIPDLGVRERHGKSEHLHTVENMVSVIDRHDIILAKSSRARKLIGKDRISVNSFHHQMIEDPGANMAIVGKSPAGITEIIEATDPKHFCFGIQSHPERFEHSDLEIFFSELAKAGSR